MSFSENVKNKVLEKCKRYCCYCEQYKGINIEVHHIVQKANNGEDTIDNAIPLCYDCHSEIGSYNPQHPKGNRFKKEELKNIRDNFYKKIENIPRKVINLSTHDKSLLDEFKNDYTKIMEYAIHTDFSSETVDINYSDNVYYLAEEKWCRRNYYFEDINLENIKLQILNELGQLTSYLTDTYFKYIDSCNKIYIKNESCDDTYRIENKLRPETLKIRKKLYDLLQLLYMY